MDRDSAGLPGIFEGLHAFVGGIAFIVGTPAMWFCALVPIVMVLVLTAGLAAGCPDGKSPSSEVH